MDEDKKSPQVDCTTSEDKQDYIDLLKLNDGNHKKCNFCKKVICISDNYCGYCGNFNPK